MVAPKLSSDDIGKGVAEAKEELLEVERTLQRESETPSLPQRMLNAVREDAAALQRIVDFGDEISRMNAGQGQAADAPWSTLMNAHAAKGDAAACERVMRDMQKAGQEPDVTTWNT